MKIKSLSTTAFGKFNKHKKWDDFSPSINVFFGENEAGKSTVFKMLIDVMFGFKQTKKEKNKLVNRLTNQLNISAEVLHNNEQIHINRELNQKSNTKLTLNHQVYLSDNDAVEAVSHINRSTYEDVYALDLNRLVAFNEVTWQEVEELLLKQYSGDTFKSAKQVIHEIDQEIKAIKKQSDRGNSIIKTLEGDRRDIFKKKKMIQMNLEEVDVLSEKLDRLNVEIEALKSKKIDLHHQLNLLEVYLPLMHLKQEQETLKERIETFKNHEDLDANSYNYHKKQVKTLYIKMDDVSEKVSKYVLEKRRLLEMLQSENLNETELNDVYQKYLSLETSNMTISEMKKRLEFNELQFKKAFENTFDEPFRPEHYEELLEINYLNLKSLIQEIESIYEEIKILKRNKRTMSNNRSSSIIVFMMLLMIGSGAVYYFDIDKIYNSIAMAVIGLSVMTIIQQLVKKRHKMLDEDDLFEERNTLRTRLIKELNGIRLSSIAAEFIGQEFLVQILNLKSLSEQYIKEKNEFEIKYDYNQHMNQQVDQFIKSHCGDEEEAPFDLMYKRLEEVKKFTSRVDVINGQLDMLNEQLQDFERELNEKEAWLLEADRFLKVYGDGDIVKGVSFLDNRIHDVMRLEELDKKIQSTDYQVDVLETFVLDYQKTTSDELFDKAYLQTELEIATQTFNDKTIEYAALVKDKDILLDQSDLGVVKSELEFVELELMKYKEQYDQLQLLRYIIQDAEEQYRAENQPAVFALAGEYLNIITDGKYNHLEVVEVMGQKKSYEIHVKMDNSVVRVDETFSMGTLNQIYLALRLSLIDYLDDGKEALPVCFDELLVNWDHKRLDQTLKIIQKISKQRQVIIFTCHAWFLDAIKDVEHVKIFRL